MVQSICLSLNFSYFYDSDSFPGFELTYVWHTITLIGIVRSYGAIDSLFMAMCIHIGAGYMDLCNMILEIDVGRLANKNPDIYNSLNIENDPNNLTAKCSTELLANIKKCIDFFALMDE